MRSGFVKSAPWLLLAIFCFAVAAIHVADAAREAGAILFSWHKLLDDQLLNVVLLAAVGFWAISRVLASWRDKAAPSDSPLASVRTRINKLDDDLVALLARRQKLIQTAASIKWTNDIPARVPERVEEVLRRVAQRAKAENLDVALSQSLWCDIIEWSIAYEERLMSGPPASDPLNNDPGAGVTGVKP